MRLALLFAVAVSAQAAGLTATPQVVAWTYVSGSHNYPAQGIQLVSSTGATAYSATANSENGWLLVNAAYAASSSNLAAGAYLIPASQIDRLDSGNYQGTVNFRDSDGNTATVTVNLLVTGSVNPNPGLTLSPLSLAFNSPLNGPSQSAYVNVTGPTAGLLTVQTTQGAGWVQSVVTGAAGVYTVLVTVYPAALIAGTYRENLLFSIGTSTATLPVTITIQQQSSLIATPAALTFDSTQGGPPLQAQTIQVRSDSGQSLQFGTSTAQTGNWLFVSPGNSTPATVLVTPQVDGLTPGSYVGNVIITPQQQGPPLVIPVGLTLRPRPVLSVSAGSLSFSYTTGSPAPAPLAVQIAGGGVNPIFTVQVTGGDWLSATVPVPVAPTLMTVSVKPASLAPGNYTGAITVTGTGTAKGTAQIVVSLQVSASPSDNVTVAKVVNAASYQEGGVAPGEMVTLFGTRLASAGTVTLALDPSGKVATSLNGVQVLFNGTPGPIVYTTPTQVAAVAPYELDGRAQTTVQVMTNGTPSNSVLLPVVGSAPGVFTADASGAGPAAATSAAAGGVITLYLTGEGQTVPAGVTGKVTVVSQTPPLTPAPVLGLSVMIGNQPANFTFAGEAPGIVSGVLQLNVAVPAGLAAGQYPVAVTIGGRTSQSGVTVTVQ